MITAGLRHGFNHQHAGHDGVAGEMPLEERLVEGDILDGNQTLGALKLHHAIDEKKGIAMGKEVQNLLDI